MDRQEAIALAQKIKEIRRKKFHDKKISLTTLLRLREMNSYERESVMDKLVKDGYADSVDEIKRMLDDKRLCLGNGYDSPTESTGMSDDVLDAGIQYIGINKDLL